MHRTENQIYIFPEKELRGISPSSYIHVSVSDLYIPRLGPHILGIARHQSQFLDSLPVSDLYIYSQDRSTHLAAAKYVDRAWEYISLSQIY
jgi:hypothetical protein